MIHLRSPIDALASSQLKTYLHLRMLVEFVQDRVKRVYTHGSPPIAAMNVKSPARKASSGPEEIQCEILEAFDLPATMVYGYVQPYVSCRSGLQKPSGVPFGLINDSILAGPDRPVLNRIRRSLSFG